MKYQAWLLLPALFTVTVGLQYHSFTFLLRKKSKYHLLEWALMLAHVILYLACVFSLFAFWPALLFVVIHQALTGFYLGSIFAPNHKGMLVLEKASKVDFFHRQVLTARNIHAHPVTDFGYGGLNYQIEHHLFPGDGAQQAEGGPAHCERLLSGACYSVSCNNCHAILERDFGPSPSNWCSAASSDTTRYPQSVTVIIRIAEAVCRLHFASFRVAPCGDGPIAANSLLPGCAQME